MHLAHVAVEIAGAAVGVAQIDIRTQNRLHEIISRRQVRSETTEGPEGGIFIEHGSLVRRERGNIPAKDTKANPSRCPPMAVRGSSVSLRLMATEQAASLRPKNQTFVKTDFKAQRRGRVRFRRRCRNGTGQEQCGFSLIRDLSSASGFGSAPAGTAFAGL